MSRIEAAWVITGMEQNLLSFKLDTVPYLIESPMRSAIGIVNLNPAIAVLIRQALPL